MNTRADIETRLQFELSSAKNSTRYTAEVLTREVKEAYLWATQLFIWQELVRAKDTVTGLNQEYYDYPQEFRTSTIIRLEVDGEKHERKNYEDYLDYKKANPSATKKIFANYGRQYFIFPTPKVAGLTIRVWGAIQADDLSLPTSKTIFSDSNAQGNDAIMLKALAVLGNDPKKEDQALAILTRLYKLQLNQLQRDQRIQHPKFEVPDYFRTGSGISYYGKFSLDPGE